ncbi:50S ribosomal protein L6 [Coccidioides posadasii str. Silveira]|uniref:3'(2'),5'-bisphosphate nucleotidase n=1 Tax=Coccidioides posadasii (strain RMSCC 757 / Silveira) TaxID=443226 RepID=E9CWN0_COCPS|nr:50S ribosomal protein L6 [Coccidioides posadasii str. Silveira]
MLREQSRDDRPDCSLQSDIWPSDPVLELQPMKRPNYPQAKLFNLCRSRDFCSIALSSIVVLILALSLSGCPRILSPLVTPRCLFTSSLFPRKMSYQQELLVAQLAVQRAAILTQKVFYEKTKGTLSKDDFSPVTKGDFGAQALIIQAIRANFPQDEVVGEEDADSLRENDALRNEMWNLVKDIKLTDAESDKVIGGPFKNETEMLDALDGGKSPGGPKGRIWALDPIDGTKGFLRGGQYAVCLGLIEDGDVKVGVIGCPNLPLDDSAPLSAEIGQSGAAGTETGVLFSAVKGQGATSRPLSDGAVREGKAISMRPVTDITKACFCEGVEAGHSAQDDNAEVARRLGINSPSVRLDSQAKYCSIARGAGDIYLRLPVRADYEEKIWDHAAGDLIVREAGGEVTDITGNRLDFTKGRKLSANRGVVAAPKSIFEQVINAVRAVYAAKASI